MRYIWSLIWGFLLMQMLTYVVSAILGLTYDLKTGTILAVIMIVMGWLISTLIPNDPAKKH